MTVRIKVVPSSGSIEEVDKDGNLNDRERRAELFPGYDNLKKLSLGIVEGEDPNKDYVNCRTKEFDKKYTVSKTSGKRGVELSKKFDCDFAPREEPKEINPHEVERFQKLAAIQKKYDNAQDIKIAKPVFDRFMAWLDEQ